jgi:hypothetical protein
LTHRRHRFGLGLLKTRVAVRLDQKREAPRAGLRGAKVDVIANYPYQTGGSRSFQLRSCDMPVPAVVSAVATEALYMDMDDAKTHPTHSVPFQRASFPVKPGYAPEWGIVNYTMFRISPTAYSEHSVGVTWRPDKIITLRPELRFDHSYNTAAFDNGARRNQFTVSMDFVIHY